MKVPSIHIVFNRKNLNNKQNRYSVYLRITIDRTSKYVIIPTPEKISKNDWNFRNNGINYVKNSNYFAFEINEKIREYKNRANDIIKRYYNQNKSITFEHIMQHLQRKNTEMTFNIFVNEYIKNPKEKFELATITKYKSFLKHLNEFNNKIYFNDISPELVGDFKAYLEIEKILVGSTMKSYFDKFKKIVNQAERIFPRLPPNTLFV